MIGAGGAYRRRSLLANVQYYEPTSVDEVLALLAEHGWVAEATQAGEWSANYGRWPFPVALRGTAGVPRIFFVRAWRNPSP